MQPSTGVTPTPRVTEIVQSAYTDALPLMRSRQQLWIVFAVIAALGGLLLPFLSATMTTLGSDGSSQRLPGLRLPMAAYFPILLGGISALFVIGSVLRTVRPGWHWTVGVFFTLIGLVSAFELAVEIGLVLLIVPGIFVAIRWSQPVWCYLLSEGKDPFDESWEITKGMFWRTFLFLLLLCVALTATLAVTYGIAVGIAYALPVLGFLLLPVAYLAYTFALHVSTLANMRWMLSLRAAHSASALPTTSAPIPAGG